MIRQSSCLPSEKGLSGRKNNALFYNAGYLYVGMQDFLRIKVYGRRNIPKNGGFILASNHVSLLDPVLLGVICKRRLNFMAKHDLFLNPLFGGYYSA